MSILSLVAFFLITNKEDKKDTNNLNELGNEINKLYRMLERKWHSKANIIQNLGKEEWGKTK